MKKIVIMVLSLVVCLCMSSTICAAVIPSDVQGTKYETAVKSLVEKNIINGFEDGTYKPNENVTRAQLAKIICEALKLEEVTDSITFSDVASNHWAMKYINTASKNNIITGYTDGTFKPEANVTYAEAVTMVMRAIGKDVGVSSTGKWYDNYMNKAKENNLLEKIEGVTEEQSLNRGDTALLTYNMLQGNNNMTNDEFYAFTDVYDKLIFRDENNYRIFSDDRVNDTNSMVYTRKNEDVMQISIDNGQIRNYISIPYVNLDLEIADELNKEFETVYNDVIEQRTTALRDENYFLDDNNVIKWYEDINYDYYLNNDILSIVVYYGKGYYAADYEVETYNINIKTGKLLTVPELINFNRNVENNLSNEEILERVKELYIEVFNTMDLNYGYEVMLENVPTNINDLKAFMDENGKIYICTINVFDGIIGSVK